MTITEIWRTYHNDVRRFIISKVKDLTIADDLLQETFIKIHTKLYTLKDPCKLKSWIFSIARHTMMDYFKSKEFQLHADNNLEIPDSEEEFTMDHTVEDCLKEIMKNLPKTYREPLFLYDIKGLKQSEIASQLQLPLSTVKSQIQRGRKQIIKGFVDCCGFELNEKGQLIGEVKMKEDCKICN